MGTSSHDTPAVQDDQFDPLIVTQLLQLLPTYCLAHGLRILVVMQLQDQLLWDRSGERIRTEDLIEEMLRVEVPADSPYCPGHKRRRRLVGQGCNEWPVRCQVLELSAVSDKVANVYGVPARGSNFEGLELGYQCSDSFQTSRILGVVHWKVYLYVQGNDGRLVGEGVQQLER